MGLKNLIQKTKKLLKSTFGESPSSKTPEPEAISNDEMLARFLFQSNQFNTAGIKQAAFLPAKNLETSVFRKSKMSGGEYADIKELLSKERNKPVHATALLSNKSIPPDSGLKVEPEESQHKWHANIAGWPEEKHAQKHIAQQLARLATRE